MLKIENIENFNLDDTVTCGQIFRYTSLEDGSYTIVLDDRVINVKYKNNTLYVESNNYDNLKEKVIKYFDLDRDYDAINKTLISGDKSLEEIVLSCNGLKMINSFPFETLISYIISQNNSVPSIKKSVDKILKTKDVKFDQIFPKLSINYSEQVIESSYNNNYCASIQIFTLPS